MFRNFWSMSDTLRLTFSYLFSPLPYDDRDTSVLLHRSSQVHKFPRVAAAVPFWTTLFICMRSFSLEVRHF